MAKILSLLHRDHVHVTRLLDYMADQSAKLVANGDFDAAMMYVVMHYMIHYPDVFHHPREDKVFDLIQKYDATITPIIKRLQAEHKELASLGEELLSLYETAREGGSENTGYMSQATEFYINLHREHMLTEETKVFPLVNILLSEKDLRKIDEQVKWREDPLFGEVTDTVYAVLLQALENT